MMSRKMGMAAVCALTIAAAVDSAASDDGIVRLRRVPVENNKMFEEIYFSKVLSGEDPVLILEAGPFKLEASCKTREVMSYDDYVSDGEDPALSEETASASSTASSTGSIYHGASREGYADFNPSRSHMETMTEGFAVLELTYTAADADYLYGNTLWWEIEDDQLPLVGSYEAGESRKNVVYRGFDGSDNFGNKLQTLSGYVMSIGSGGGTIGIHKANVDDLPGGSASFPAGVDCMVAGFVTYIVPAVGLAEAEAADPRSVKYL